MPRNYKLIEILSNEEKEELLNSEEFYKNGKGRNKNFCIGTKESPYLLKWIQQQSTFSSAIRYLIEENIFNLGGIVNIDEIAPRERNFDEIFEQQSKDDKRKKAYHMADENDKIDSSSNILEEKILELQRELLNVVKQNQQLQNELLSVKQNENHGLSVSIKSPTKTSYEETQVLTKQDDAEKVQSELDIIPQSSVENEISMEQSIKQSMREASATKESLLDKPSLEAHTSNDLQKETKIKQPDNRTEPIRLIKEENILNDENIEESSIIHNINTEEKLEESSLTTSPLPSYSDTPNVSKPISEDDQEQPLNEEDRAAMIRQRMFQSFSNKKK